jgi:uncharacterized phage protein (TIGR01671 family)
MNEVPTEMRDIEFRGLRADGSGWAFGSLVKTGSGEYLIVGDWDYECGFDFERFIHGVIPETVGQYTGLKDKNSMKIFEGDIVKNTQIIGTEQIYYIKWSDTYRCLMAFKDYALNGVNPEAGSWMPYTDYEMSLLEVIGNIHDSPELLRAINS